MSKISNSLLAFVVLLSSTTQGLCNEQLPIPSHILTNEPDTKQHLKHNHVDGPIEEPIEVLEEKITPTPLPAILDKPKTKEEEKSYATMLLFLFNVAIFTAGMAIVKAIDGKNAP